MTRHYPAFLDLRGKRVLVVGSGAVARRKARDARSCGALVRRVAEDAFARRDLRGIRLAISACSAEERDARVAALCRARGVWVNVVDRPRLCDFIAPALLRRGRITVAVSTGGASPALARALRLRLEPVVTPQDARLCARLARLRPALLALPLPERRRRLKELLA